VAALARAGADARPVGDDALAVDAPPAKVGEIAAAERVVLHELVAESESLEDIFLELTEGVSTPS
jgi:ABC-2 type transport system ATP-binding protein